MKLVEKKCPNCGASIDFNYGDKNIKCSYCRSKFAVTGYEEESKVENEVNFDSLQLQKITKFTVGLVSTFIIIGAILTFVIAFTIFNRMRRNIDEQNKVSSNMNEEISNRISSQNEQYNNMVSNMLEE